MAPTPNRGYPTPDPANWVSDDVGVLIAAFAAIDLDVAAVLLALNQKAAVSHTHTIADISSLQTILDNKAAQNHTHSLGSLSDVTTTSVANGMVLTFAGSQWVAASPSTVFGSHTHSIDQVTGLSDALSSKIDVAGMNGAAVKNVPVDADSVSLLDSQASGVLKRLTWSSIKSTLKSYFDGLYAPAALLPSGSVIEFAGLAAPAGYLVCSGQAVSRSSYPSLYGAIGTAYGAGDGTTTFNLPNAPSSLTLNKIIKT